MCVPSPLIAMTSHIFLRDGPRFFVGYLIMWSMFVPEFFMFTYYLLPLGWISYHTYHVCDKPPLRDIYRVGLYDMLPHFLNLDVTYTISHLLYMYVLYPTSYSPSHRFGHIAHPRRHVHNCRPQCTAGPGRRAHVITSLLEKSINLKAKGFHWAEFCEKECNLSYN